MSKIFLIKKYELMPYVFLIILSIQCSFVNTELEFNGLLSTMIVVSECFILLVYLWMRKFNKRTLSIIIILLFISVITYYKTGYTSFMVILMTAIVFEKLDYSKAFHLIFFIRFVMLIVIITCSILGILNIFEMSVSKSDLNGIIGYGLGFTHPNRLAMVFEYIVMVYICYKNDKLRNSHLVILTILTVIVYYITKTRTLILSVGTMILLIQLYKFSYTTSIMKLILTKISLFIMPICTAISIIVPMLMLTASGKLQTFLYAVNGLLSSRFTHIYRAFLNYPITLFGGVEDFSILQDVYGYSTVDNGYIRLLYGFGIIGFFTFLVLSVLTVRKLIQRKEYIYLIIYIVFCFCGLNENIFTSIACNIVAPFWSELLRNYDRKELRK